MRKKVYKCVLHLKIKGSDSVEDFTNTNVLQNEDSQHIWLYQCYKLSGVQKV